MPADRALAGKVAVVTGASSGVGRAIARAYAAAGARLGLIARDPIGLEAAAREVEASGSEALILPLDVTDAAAVDAAADRVAARWGGIDIWVNDAMVSVFSPIAELTPAEVRRVMEVDFLGTVHGTMAALRHMRPRDRGVIVQIGSALAYRSIPLQSAYCAAKAAVRGFTDSLRTELFHERSAIAVTHLVLPAVNTPQFEVVRNRMPGHPRPVGTIYQPELIAGCALELALRPRREAWIGGSTVLAMLGQRLLPGLLDRILARRAWSGQLTTSMPAGHPIRHAADNVDRVLHGDRGAHGPFDREARATSRLVLLARHRRSLVAGAGLVVALAALGRVTRLRRAAARGARARRRGSARS
jgi:NAD(P)-dependent dehydrogenase (short-subunit alcohol dehydrogenase family)